MEKENEEAEQSDLPEWLTRSLDAVVSDCVEVDVFKIKDVIIGGVRRDEITVSSSHMRVAVEALRSYLKGQRCH